MVKPIKFILLLLITETINAQTALYNSGSLIQVTNGGILFVGGNFYNATGSDLRNDGTLIIKNDLTNKQVMNNAFSGLLELSGTNAQQVNGSNAFFANNLMINNSSTSGVSINSRLIVNGTCNFTDGIVTASNSNYPLQFTSTGIATNVNDNCHVVGYVQKDGTGIFNYPVGDGIKYQKVATNLSANEGGMLVQYNSADAGTGTFSNLGTENLALKSYNPNEYWNITPVSTATGTVTIFWDGYKDHYSNDISQRKVAHKTGINWYNEGNVAVGTSTSGSVTSNSLSSWSPFTLGSIVQVLPLQWLSFNGSLNNIQQASLNWQVQETNVLNYQIQKSPDAISFNTIGNINSKGEGVNYYNFTESTVLNGAAFYRLKETDKDGRFNYSKLLRLNNAANNKGLLVYPNPVKNLLNIEVDAGMLQKNVMLYNSKGQVVKVFRINNLSSKLNVSKLPSGIYLLKMEDGDLVKIVKE